MRTKWLAIGLVLILSLTFVFSAGAQSPSVEWEAWNAQITAHSNSSEIDVAETQIINVLDGTIHAGERNYSSLVDIQSVYLAINNGQPQTLDEGSGPGMYEVTSSGSDVVLDYELPEAVSAGDTFAVQINYTTTTPTAGLIDWFVVPGDHGAPVNSSTVTVNFPDGEVPSTDFVRLSDPNATISTEGNSIVIRSQSVIPADAAFEIQVPYGSGVGQPANNGSGSSNPVQNVPVAPTTPTGTTDDSGGFSILGLLCVVLLVVVLGGRGMLGGLLGGLLGGGLGSGLGGTRSGGGIFGGGNSGGTSTPLNPTSSTRGFRESSNQNRQVPTINSDKQRGGGARFK